MHQPPVHEILKFHDEQTWWDALHQFQCPAIAASIHKLPMVAHFGKPLFDNNTFQLIVNFVKMLASRFSESYKEGFHLVKCNSNLYLQHHYKEIEDPSRKDVQSQLCYAAYRDGDYAIRCSLVIAWITNHEQKACNASRPLEHDGEAIDIPGVGPVNCKFTKYCSLLVFRSTQQGVYAVKLGFGVAVAQFQTPLTAAECHEFSNMLEPSLIAQTCSAVMSSAHFLGNKN